MQIRKCPDCKRYTIKEICNDCNKKTFSTDYKYKKIRDAPKDSSRHFLKRNSTSKNNPDKNNIVIS